MKKLFLLIIFLGSIFSFNLVPAEKNKEDLSYLPPEVKTLVDKTFSINARERAEAAYQLGKIGEKAEKASPFLIRLLDDNIPVFCRYNGYGVWSTPGKEAAKALAKIGKGTLKYIIPVFENNHPYISLKPDMQRNIIIYLTELSGENFGEDISKWINWIRTQMSSS